MFIRGAKTSLRTDGTQELKVSIRNKVKMAHSLIQNVKKSLSSRVVYMLTGEIREVRRKFSLFA